MAFKQISDLSAELTISLGGTNKKTGKKNPTTVEGYYLGKREVEDRKKKSGVSYIYFLQTSKGNLGVWGKTDMDRKLTSVKEGEMIRITHTGMQATANGDMYKYSVEVDSDNTIEVVGANAASNNTQDEDDGPTLDTSEGIDEDEDDNSYEAEERTQQAALSAAERAAKVKALLSKNKRG
jgi:hypothetical protein